MQFKEYEYSSVYTEVKNFEEEINGLIRRYNDAIEEGDEELADDLLNEINDLDAEAREFIERID